MELSDFVGNLTGSLIGGFAIGLIGTHDRTEERAAYICASLSDEELKKRSIDKNVNSMLRSNRNMKLFLPFMYSGICTALYSLGQQPSADDYEGRFFTSLSGFLVGRSIGSLTRRFFKRDYHRDIKIARIIKKTPERVQEYLTEEQNKIINASFSEIEERLLKEDPQILRQEAEKNEGPLYRMQQAILSHEKPYTTHALMWGVDKFIDIVKRTQAPRQLNEFFQEAPPLSTCVFGESNGVNLRVYEVTGDHLAIYTGTLENFKSALFEERHAMAISLSPPIFNQESVSVWNRDYRALAENIEKHHDGTTVILINTSLPLPDGDRSMIATQTFANAYAQREREKYRDMSLGFDPTIN